MSTPITDTTTTAAVPAAPLAVRWFYWITWSSPANTGSTECSFPARITHGTQLLEIAQQLAQHSSTPKVSIDGFILLRVEDAAGQVIG